MKDGQIYTLRNFAYHCRHNAYDLADAVQMARNESGGKLRKEKDLELSETQRTARLKEMLQKTDVEKTPEMEQILENHLNVENHKHHEEGAR